jgi:hypothetical protein
MSGNLGTAPFEELERRFKFAKDAQAEEILEEIKRRRHEEYKRTFSEKPKAPPPPSTEEPKQTKAPPPPRPKPDSKPTYTPPPRNGAFGFSGKASLGTRIRRAVLAFIFVVIGWFILVLWGVGAFDERPHYYGGYGYHQPYYNPYRR